MNRLLVLCLVIFLSLSAVEAKENHQVGIKLGLTSIDNEDGWNFEKGSFFTDLTFDTATVIKPRIDLGYINIDEKDKGGVDSVFQIVANGIYDIDLRSYNTNITPYLLGGLGYEHVFDETPVFESHPFMQAGIGVRYVLTDRVTLVSEFRALQMFDSSKNDEDNEFALMFGLDFPLFVEVIRAPVEKETFALPKVTKAIPKLAPAVQYHEPIVVDGDKDGVSDDIDNCPHTPAGSRIDSHGCTIVSSIVIPEEVEYLEDSKKVPQIQQKTVPEKSQKRSYKTIKRQNLKISFESNSAIIKSKSKAAVKRFASYLKNNPTTTVTIEGYTDNSGSRAKNVALSQRRAEAVRALLIKYGVKASHVKAVGKGDLNPIADNETPSGRAQNRRIEAVIH